MSFRVRSIQEPYGVYVHFGLPMGKNAPILASLACSKHVRVGMEFVPDFYEKYCKPIMRDS